MAQPRAPRSGPSVVPSSGSSDQLAGGDVPSLPQGRVSLHTPLTTAIGERQAAAFARAFGQKTAGDLLSHYPRRYAHRGELTALADLPAGEDVTIVAEVKRCESRPMRQRRGSILEVTISDGTGVLSLTFLAYAVLITSAVSLLE